MGTISAERLAKTFVAVADTLVDEFDLIEFLQMLTRRVGEVVDASTVGLMLADHHRKLQFMAGSDETAKVMELFQLHHDEGPCVEAFHSAQAVVNVDLPAANERWPSFAPRATAAGIGSVHAFPLRLRSEVIGAMGVFGYNVDAVLDETDMRVVQSLADVAAISLLQERAIRRGELLAEQLQGALNSRVIIEQAKGAVAQARGISVDDAFKLIRGYTRSHNQRLGEVAYAIVSNPASVPELLPEL
jgi:GAF domain-containing protein